MTSPRPRHRTYDPDVEKVVPKDAIVLDLDSGVVREFLTLNPTGVALAGRSAYELKALRLAQEIRRQTKPSRIPEPGLWGVVEATVDHEGERYKIKLVRHPGDGSSQNWLSQDRHWFSWPALENPVLIREGVES